MFAPAAVLVLALWNAEVLAQTTAPKPAATTGIPECDK